MPDMMGKMCSGSRGLAARIGASAEGDEVA